MRPILLGMNNPQSAEPSMALWPDPPGCAGHRLWVISGMGRTEWLEMFERRNLLDSTRWVQAEGEKSADRMRGELRDRVVVMCGVDVARCVEGLPRGLFCWHRPMSGGVEGQGWWARIPHPSGKCRDWNDPIVVECARIFLEELAAAHAEG